ncbi:hypothetical protein BOX15_Mlig003701g3, partial [Macrostomum lignano]
PVTQPNMDSEQSEQQLGTSTSLVTMPSAVQTDTAARSLFSITEPSMQPAALNNLLVQMRKPLRAGLVQFSRDMLRRMKRLRKKRGSEAEVARNAVRADRLLAQVRLIRRWTQQSLCKALLGHETPLSDALAAAPGCLTMEQLALARLADTKPIRQFVDNFRSNHSDWRDLVYFMQYKNTGGRWKKKQPIKPRAPNELLAKSVNDIASRAGPDEDSVDDNDGDADEDGQDVEEAERRRRLESVLLEFRKETAGERSLGVAMGADFAVPVESAKSVAKEAKSVSKAPKSVSKNAKAVSKDANSVAKDATSVAKDSQTTTKDAKAVAKKTNPVAKDAKSVAKVSKSLIKVKKAETNVFNTSDNALDNASDNDAQNDDGWSDLFATDVPPTEMKRGLHRNRRITTDGQDLSIAPRHGERQSRKRRRDVQAQERRVKQAAVEAEQLHPSWQAKRQQKARLAAVAAAAPAHVVFDDD